jgi:hypothetical protein
MRIEDHVSFKDSKIRGVVTLKRSDSTVVFTKENMIVQSGRRYLWELFMQATNSITNNLITGISVGSIGSTYTRQFDGYTLGEIAFGSSGSATLFNQTALSREFEDTVVPRVQLSESDVELGAVDNPYIKIIARVDNTSSGENFTVHELGLFLTHATEDSVMFSRVVFDPIPIGSGDVYEVEYYIYF